MHGEVRVAISGADDAETYVVDEDEYGKYIELCFDPEMSKVILDEPQHDSMLPYEVATLIGYLSEKAKRAVVAKEDDLLTKRDLQDHAHSVSKATLAELMIWFSNTCFKIRDIKDAERHDLAIRCQVEVG